VRARRTIPASRTAALEAIGLLATFTRDNLLWLKDASVMRRPFYPEEVKTKTLEIFTYAYQAASIVQTWARTKADGTLEDSPILNTRIGPTSGALSAEATKAAIWENQSPKPNDSYTLARQDIEKLVRNKFIIADLYFTEDDFNTMQQAAEKWARIVEELARGDYAIRGQ
jgi:hypothetical protein